MNFANVILGMAIFCSYSVSFACSIQDPQDVHGRLNDGVEGVCSNNGFPISCEYTGDNEVSCDGPAGSYAGNNLNNIVFSSCGCSTGEEQGKQLKEDLEQGK